MMSLTRREFDLVSAALLEALTEPRHGPAGFSPWPGGARQDRRPPSSVASSADRPEAKPQQVH